jgi:hypothetical protein
MVTTPVIAEVEPKVNVPCQKRILLNTEYAATHVPLPTVTPEANVGV